MQLLCICQISCIQLHGLILYSFAILVTIYVHISSNSLKDFKNFADALEAVRNKGVVVSVASPEDVKVARDERPSFFQVKKAL